MLVDELRKRRTQYALGRDLPVSNEDVDALVRDCVRFSPTAFNCQGTRVLILFGQQSDALWDITTEALREVVPPEDFANTERRIAGFAAGAGTILFFEDQQVMRDFQHKNPSYADQFPVWADQSNGMAQIVVWTALAEVGVGGSLQHYNPLIDAGVSERWSLPGTWKLRAQMPFGSNRAPFAEKGFIQDELRFRTVGLGGG